MKQNNKKKFDPSNGKRQDWKNEAENEIVLLQEDIDTLDLPEETVLAIEKMITKFKERLNDSIELFEVTPEIVHNTEDLLDDVLFDVWVNKAVAGERGLELMSSIVCENSGGVFIKTDSLVQEMKVEAFIQELQENPYQLKLIA